MHQDHPHIDEKLPLDIKGIPVRETIREIFRNPENGTPDNISRAGCLALALKSNEVGGEGNGYVVWNAWRGEFPVRGMRATNDVKNHTQFAHIDFQLPENKVGSFARFHFANDADFRGALLGHCCNFQHAKWGHRANFDDAKWGNFAQFDHAYWGQFASFKRCQWGGGAHFRCAHWGQHSNFRGARWGTDCRFFGAQWDPQADFQGAHWGESAKFKGAQWGAEADFRGACWESSANFRGAQWGRDVNFCDTQWGAGVDFSAASWEKLLSVYPRKRCHAAAQAWAKTHGLSPETIGRNTFCGARFLGDVSFENRKFRGRTDFSNSDKRQRVVRDEKGCIVFDAHGNLSWEDHPDQKQFSVAPKFHGCELHQDTSFEGADFPRATVGEEAAHAYRTLKLAFSKHQAIREEQRFFRLEMEEETLRETGLKRWLFKRYRTFSDYGFSITRPLKYWGISVLAITAGYGFLSWLGQCGLSVQACRFAPQWLEFSLLQTLPLPDLNKLSEAARAEFWPDYGWWGLALLVLVIVHKTISLVALFLIGLALRNLFKLK